MTFPPVYISRVHLQSAGVYPSLRTELTALLFGEGGISSVESGEPSPKNALYVDIIPPGGVDESLPDALNWVRRGGLHLPVVVQANHTLIGPLTNLGYSACLQCVGYRGAFDGATPAADAATTDAPIDLPVLVARLVSVTVAQEVDRITDAVDALPMTLGGLIRVDHGVGTVNVAKVSQVDGCEMCSSLIELHLQGAS
ncbi:hypothetical protein [Streptomyces sp. AC550_RSS872]|uniref:hypothetical protein n=1 Tax=Streptomyces sp. AC550_RSS872 TaxID=2823689 RepID=UPI001C262535|nr:hypothetical protein [Streptomyces sp. AC550_RSS872]